MPIFKMLCSCTESRNSAHPAADEAGGVDFQPAQMPFGQAGEFAAAGLPMTAIGRKAAAMTISWRRENAVGPCQSP